MSVVDEDTARAVNAGRETIGGVLSEAQRELKKVFLVFVFAFLGTILALRWWIWDYLEAVTKAQMNESVAQEVDIIARTPFDVILMQVKIGVIVGIVLASVVGLYLARKAILGRIEDTGVNVTTGKVYGFVGLSLGLAVVGMVYAYAVFFPLMFKILAEQAYAAGAKPSYGIVRFTEFLLLLTISFALAAQLPLVMGVLSYGEIVPYETFRDKWRYAVLGIFVFGAVFSPPDPFTQIMWAIPLITLYAFSLGVAKVVTNVHRGGVRNSPVEPGTFRRKGYLVVGAFVLSGGATALALYTGHAEVIGEAVLEQLPRSASIPFLGEVTFPTTVERGGPTVWLRSGLVMGVLGGAVALAYALVAVLRMPVVPRAYVGVEEEEDPEAVDVASLDVEGVRRAPLAAFADLSESEAVDIAGEAMEAGDEEKGRLVLERWEDAQQAADGDGADGDSEDAVDLRGLDAAGVADAPDSAFAALTEEQAVEIAGAAMENGDEEKGRLVLQRWQAAEDVDEPPVTGDPANLDLRELDAGGVEAAPTEAFAAISEDEAIDIAGEAMEAGDEEKGQLVLQRWDEINEAGTAAPNGGEGDPNAVATADVEAGAGAETTEQSAATDEEGGAFDDLFSDTAGGMLGAFADEERDEDEIGGYMYDIGFILDSMRSRMFVIVAVFIGVFTATFAYLYTVGIKQIMDVFISQVPNEALAPGQRATDATDVIIALHPVEVLIFIVKFSGVLAILVTTPVILYYAWPALQQRGLAPGSGDRRAFLMWGYVLLMGTLTGAVVGFFGVAPTVISYLVTDAVQSGMVVSYRIKSLLWIVFFMTIGFGFFLNIPIGMILLHLSDLVYFESMRKYWRHFVLVTFVVAALITPGGILTMLVFAIPVAVAYVLGLLLLWLLTAPWRLFGRGRASRTS
ncbi:Sec-independent periplasmic protein translocase [Salinarchaeum sp. Harcht-Bsk1]|uniref:twin-arginine translocase subunit TatC n=1 Tax=Salinarchaeum sp. Harcht-Bsk1 TaxID=1333523 RepID=UPI000342479E|nr:twin-arginine translocase subunit TatC [Salinarchaeum sp. Harcht-Bsk1]AGN01057.1 Sec-independent periplasmic protein translocase [Salinarchaeum sp. Harcht-Bsk1]